MPKIKTHKGTAKVLKVRKSGFDPKLPGYEYQSFQGMSVEEVLEKIREEGE